MLKKAVTSILVCLFSIISIFAQNTSILDSVGAGCSTYYKIANTNFNSVFSWGIKANTGTITSGQSTDSINVEWSNSIGIDTLWVQETTDAGCISDTAKIAVRRFDFPKIDINEGNPMCFENTGNPLTFNLSGIPPFTVTYKKNGNTIIQSGIEGYIFSIPSTEITETSVYALISIKDKIGCEKFFAQEAIINIIPQLKQLEIIKN